MKRLLILGAGSAGTMMANHLVKKLDLNQWKITVVDEHQTHYYQPGFLFIPFGTYSKKDVCKDKAGLIPKKIEYIPLNANQIRKGVKKMEERGEDHDRGKAYNCGNVWSSKGANFK